MCFTYPTDKLNLRAWKNFQDAKCNRMAIKINIILTAVGKDLIKGLTPLGCFFRCGSEQNKQISSLSCITQQAVSIHNNWYNSLCGLEI